ncbi:hypothetical protein AWB64_06216 [Caballeronia sordidicola]|uniref:Uncharacterized protein n=1 Tax=Caballeronia sordidicola TaxID=196367 RepID=A0A158IIA2_CABSO|nr:hypothetical protein AWB64_06216 [Caballeronia sordidicola]
MQQMQEMPADGIVVRFGFDAPAVMRIVIPVEQDRPQRRHQAVSNVFCARDVVILFFGQHGAEYGDAGAHDVHGMGGCWNPFERRFQVRGQATQSLEPGLVRLEFGGVGQLAMHEQIGDLLELGRAGDIENVIAAIMQIVARLADSAQRGVTRGHT